MLAGVGFGRQVRAILTRGDVPLRQTGVTAGYTHEKLMYVSGRYAGSRGASLVWTGSHNWTDRSLHNDELTLRVRGARAVAAYQRNFRRIWAASAPR